MHVKGYIGIGLICILGGMACIPLSSNDEKRAHPQKVIDAPDFPHMIGEVPLPQGYTRINQPDGTFGEWLRKLKLREKDTPVLLYNGQKKRNQSVHYAVLDVSVGKRNLQQCADAVMRLRAEYAFASGQKDKIQFHFTSGDLYKYSDYTKGIRPKIVGRKVYMRQSAKPDTSYVGFLSYMDIIFSYAGTLSLERELKRVNTPQDFLPGDVFIQGGSPGHAILVIDVAVHAGGQKVFMLAQSYMPAQDIHILINPEDSSLSPWYSADIRDQLRTPEWTFPSTALKKF